MLIGHEDNIRQIRESLEIAEAGLHTEDCPIGAFLLLGPTGVGKTQTAVYLAQQLHKDPSCYLRIDCGEFQLDHEVAKLIGAPPGYLGHRETAPILNQARLNGVKSTNCPVSIVLFDEFDKASPVMERAILGVLDKGVLTSGDNQKVNFGQSLILFSSNEGDYSKKGMGFLPGRSRNLRSQLRGNRRVEFINRLTGVLEYQRLTQEQLLEVLALEIQAIENKIFTAWGVQLSLELNDPAGFLLGCDTHTYGARDIKRNLKKVLILPLIKAFREKEWIDGEYPGFFVKNKTPFLKKARLKKVGK